MSYRYKQDFGKCFRDLPLPQNEGAISHPLIELDEVYRKAEAFDEIARSFYEIRKDIKDKNVDYQLGYQTIGTEVAKYIKKYESEESE